MVVFYAVKGIPDFVPEEAVSDGELAYFLFADEVHCVKYMPSSGWTGTCFQ